MAVVCRWTSRTDEHQTFEAGKSHTGGLIFFLSHKMKWGFVRSLFLREIVLQIDEMLR